MHTSEKKSAGTVRQTGSAPAELPRVANAVHAPRGERRTAGRSRRHGEWRGGASFSSLATHGDRLCKTFISDAVNSSAVSSNHHVLPVTRRHRTAAAHSLRALVGSTDIIGKFTKARPEIDQVRVCHDANGYNKHHIAVNRFRCDLHLRVSVSFAP